MGLTHWGKIYMEICNPTQHQSLEILRNYLDFCQLLYYIFVQTPKLSPNLKL